MTSISTAVGSDRRSRVSGYKIKKGFFDNVTPNLPQVIVVLGEANHANQGALSVLKREVTSADEAGTLYGYGSPIHQIMKILRPASGDGVGGIPTLVIAQAADAGATATAIVWTVTGTASASATHSIFLAGREYPYSVVSGDTPTAIAAKILAVIAADTGAPFTPSVAAGVLTLTTKWKGLTSAEEKATISNNGTAAGVTYALTSTTAGTGLVDLAPALSQFEDNWYTTVINPYGSAQFTALEAFNGVPDDETPTGRYSALVMKPFMAFFGSTLSDKTALAAITNAAGRIAQVTNVLCPAPGSDGMPWEAAANVVALFARIMQDSPHLDVNGKSYPDMPTPVTIGDMSDYNNRDFLVKKGCSTVALVNGAYQIQDLITTYHPTGESPLQFAYCRNLNLDWNVKDGYTTLERINVRDHVIVADKQITGVSNGIKPKEWKSILFNYFDELAQSLLIKDPEFSKASLQVQIDTDNPDRFDVAFKYRRTGIARITSTDATAGF